MTKKIFNMDTIILLVIVVNIGVLAAMFSVYAKTFYLENRHVDISINDTTDYRVENFYKHLNLCGETHDSDVEKIKCMQPFIENNFNYISTDENAELTVEEILTNGADCQFWSEVWETIFDYYEISFERQVLQSGPDTYHQFDIAYSNEGYCTVDMKYVNCVTYG